MMELKGLLRKGGERYDFTYISRFSSTSDLCGRDNGCFSGSHCREEGNQAHKQKLARFFFFFLLLMSVIIPSVPSYAFSPCHEDSGIFLCDVNGRGYDTFQECFNSCYFLGPENERLHVSRAVVETFYVVCGLLLGIFFLTAIVVGLR